mmetsp:Transcript_73254/g.136905  ORF Transcript_73254/g.136905 Transcript_73254/m.136905 type:complete len:201 (+) Transcript_73254:203-805(+)
MVLSYALFSSFRMAHMKNIHPATIATTPLATFAHLMLKKALHAMLPKNNTRPNVKLNCVPTHSSSISEVNSAMEHGYSLKFCAESRLMAKVESMTASNSEQREPQPSTTYNRFMAPTHGVSSLDSGKPKAPPKAAPASNAAGVRMPFSKAEASFLQSLRLGVGTSATCCGNFLNLPSCGLVDRGSRTQPAAKPVSNAVQR